MKYPVGHPSHPAVRTIEFTMSADDLHAKRAAKRKKAPVAKPKPRKHGRR